MQVVCPKIFINICCSRVSLHERMGMRTPIEVEYDSLTQALKVQSSLAPMVRIELGVQEKKEDGILDRLNESVQNTVSIPNGGSRRT